MNKKLGLAGLVLAAVLGTGCAQPGNSPATPTAPTLATPTPQPTPWPTPFPESERAKTYALMHLWYKSGQDNCPSTETPAKPWTAWIWPPKIDDPCITIPGAPWLRQISSNAYPLTGPYDSRNEDIIRYQIRQAKAAGIDGFFTPLYTWAAHLKYLEDIFFGNSTKKGLLQIAHEEKFQVGLELWGLEDWELDAYDPAWKMEVNKHVASLEASPYKDAYIQIDGRPAVWLRFPSYMPQKDMLYLFDGSPRNPRKITWLFRDLTLEQTLNLNDKFQNSKAQFIDNYCLPSWEDWEMKPNFLPDLEYVAKNPNLGQIPIAHAYAGYDERWGKTAKPYRGRYGYRRGTAHMTTFLETSVNAGAKIIFIESWNEWGEGSTIEAGLNISKWRHMGQEQGIYQDASGNDAPYLYLDALRKFNGMQAWVPPYPPPCTTLDALMRALHQKELPETMRCIPDATTKGRE